MPVDATQLFVATNFVIFRATSRHLPWQFGDYLPHSKITREPF
jgi:hypothetical protein